VIYSQDCWLLEEEKKDVSVEACDMLMDPTKILVSAAGVLQALPKVATSSATIRPPQSNSSHQIAIFHMGTIHCEPRL
jgi:hypothetical protein